MNEIYKTRAHQLVARAVRRGELPHVRTRDCADCGQRAEAYDHRDYARPLDVVPVCHRCNLKRGAGIAPAEWAPARQQQRKPAPTGYLYARDAAAAVGLSLNKFYTLLWAKRVRGACSIAMGWLIPEGFTIRPYRWEPKSTRVRIEEFNAAQLRRTDAPVKRAYRHQPSPPSHAPISIAA